MTITGNDDDLARTIGILREIIGWHLALSVQEI